MIIKNLYTKTVEDIIFDVLLRGRIVVVDGDSDTGKTFLCKTIKEKQFVPKSFTGDKMDYSKIIVLNYLDKGVSEIIRKTKNKLIIIDNADIILNSEDVKYIREDIKNQYLIFSRGPLEFYISPNYRGYMEKKGKCVSLHYRSSEKGWF